MTISQISRYIQGTVTRMPDGNGTYQLAVLRTVPVVQDGQFTLYMWRSGDRPDIVASDFLGDPSLWWAIFDINPEIIYPLNIPPGTPVRIPTGPIMGQGTLIQ